MKPNCEPSGAPPDTRKKLLGGLAEKGFGSEQLTEMQKIIDAEKSDHFDVLAHVAWALPTVTREHRATIACPEITAHFNSKPSSNSSSPTTSPKASENSTAKN